MSVNLMSAVFSADELTPTEKLVLLAMTDFANDDGQNIYPSIETLSRKTALTERTIQRTIKELQERGIVEITIQGNGRYHTNEYRIHRGSLSIKEKGDRVSRKGDRQYTKGDRVSRKGDPTARKGDTRSPDPSLTIIDPSIESSVEVGGTSLVNRWISVAAGLVTLPPNEYNRIEQISSLVDFYGFDKSVEVAKTQAEKWRKTKSEKSGRCYKITTMGWVDWTQEALMETEKSARQPKKQLIQLPSGEIVEVNA